MEIIVFVLSLALLATLSQFGGVDSRELEFARQPDIQRLSR